MYVCQTNQDSIYTAPPRNTYKYIADICTKVNTVACKSVFQYLALVYPSLECIIITNIENEELLYYYVYFLKLI